MNENSPNILLAIFVFVGILLLFVGNFYYQRKARFYADEILKENSKEFNKQITANAYICLVSRIFWGTVALVFTIWNIRKIETIELSWWFFLIVFELVFALFFIVWGFLGYKREMKRKIDLV